MSDKFVLEAEKRTIVGKKVSKLRANGKIPGVVYGPNKESFKITVEWTKLRTTLLNAGGTNVVDLKVDGKTYPTLIRHVDRDPVRRDVLHIDFYLVDLTQKVVSTIPVVLLNMEKAQTNLGGVAIVHESLFVEIETLPAEIPSEVVLDLLDFPHKWHALHVSDLPKLPGVDYLSDPEMVLVRSELPRGSADTDDGEFTTTMAEPELVRRQRSVEIED